MAAKSKRKPDDPEQSNRFIEAAKTAETDESPKAFDRVFKKVVKPPKVKTAPT